MSLPDARLNRRTVLAATAAAAVGTGYGVLGNVRSASATPSQVIAAKKRLTDQGYFCGPVDATLGDLTTCAVLAYQKANGLAVDGILDYPVMVALKTPRVPPHFTSKGSVVEVDLARQLVRVVFSGKVVASLHASTGDAKESTVATRAVLNRTPKGRFRLREASEAGEVTTSLGVLFRPHYFQDHYAVYGHSDLASVRGASTLGGVAVHSSALLWLESKGYLPTGRLVVVA